jgi:hypothetical protein
MSLALFLDSMMCVASLIFATLTFKHAEGLLAEFGHELNRRLKNKGIIQQNIKHLDLTEKDRLARKSQLLIHRVSEAEAGVAENEPKK